MSANTSSDIDGLKTYLVIGGEGFVGHQLVKDLHERYGEQAKIYSSSRTQRYFDDFCKFIRCDLTSADSLRDVLEQSGAKTVFLAAASHFDATREVAHAVNVQGMISCLEACRQAKVRRLVVTSSTVVIFNGKSVENADETSPYAPEHRTHYAASKSEQEQIAIKANGNGGVYITVCRPNGMIGEGDVQVLPELIQVLKNGQGWVQVGDNTNLCEFDNVRNVTYGHILACEKLLDPSDASKPGPSAGEIFNITGGREHAMPMFTFVRWVMKEYNGYDPKFILKIPMSLGMALAYVNAFLCGLLGLTATGMTPDTMVYATAARWHNIDKAKRILGYEPIYSVADGLKEGLAAYRAQEKQEAAARAAKGLDKTQAPSGVAAVFAAMIALVAVLAIVFAVQQRTAAATASVLTDTAIKVPLVCNHMPAKMGNESYQDLVARIHYSDRYSDDVWEYRHVILPKALLKQIKGDLFDDAGLLKILSDKEWRGIGITQSMGWEHYEVHAPEPHILLFRREKDYQDKYGAHGKPAA